MFSAVILVVGLLLYRLVPHPIWFAPFLSLAIVGVRMFPRQAGFNKWAPLSMLLVSDMAINWATGYPLLSYSRGLDYLLFAAFVVQFSRGPCPAGRVARFVTGMGAPWIFFLVSNFGVWAWGIGLSGSPYPATLSGIGACYSAGLPFLGGLVVGDYLVVTAAQLCAVSRHAYALTQHPHYAESL